MFLPGSDAFSPMSCRVVLLFIFKLCLWVESAGEHTLILRVQSCRWNPADPNVVFCRCRVFSTAPLSLYVGSSGCFAKLPSLANTLILSLYLL